MKGQRYFIEEQALEISNARRGIGRGGEILSARGSGKGRQYISFVEWYKCLKPGHYQSECPSCLI